MAGEIAAEQNSHHKTLSASSHPQAIAQMPQMRVKGLPFPSARGPRLLTWLMLRKESLLSRVMEARTLRSSASLRAAMWLLKPA